MFLIISVVLVQAFQIYWLTFISFCEPHVLTGSLALSLWDGVVVQQHHGAVSSCSQVLLFPGLIQITLRLQ